MNGVKEKEIGLNRDEKNSFREICRLIRVEIDRGEGKRKTLIGKGKEVEGKWESGGWESGGRERGGEESKRRGNSLR